MVAQYRNHSAKEARQAFVVVSDLADNRCPPHETLFTALEAIQLPRPDTVAEWGRTARFLMLARIAVGADVGSDT